MKCTLAKTDKLLMLIGFQPTANTSAGCAAGCLHALLLLKRGLYVKGSWGYCRCWAWNQGCLTTELGSFLCLEISLGFLCSEDISFIWDNAPLIVPSCSMEDKFFHFRVLHYSACKTECRVYWEFYHVWLHVIVDLQFKLSLPTLKK